jgi:hypothetical protein
MIAFIVFLAFVGLTIWAVNTMLNALRDFDD